MSKRKKKKHTHRHHQKPAPCTSRGMKGVDIPSFSRTCVTPRDDNNSSSSTPILHPHTCPLTIPLNMNSTSKTALVHLLQNAKLKRRQKAKVGDVRCALLGVHIPRGMNVPKHTKDMGRVQNMVLYMQLLAVFSGFGIEFGRDYTCMWIARNCPSQAHRDNNGDTYNVIFTLGTYTGGEFYVNGRCYDTTKQLVCFDARQQHQVRPIRCGTRWSVVVYTDRRTRKWLHNNPAFHLSPYPTTSPALNRPLSRENMLLRFQDTAGSSRTERFLPQDLVASSQRCESVAGESLACGAENQTSAHRKSRKRLLQMHSGNKRKKGFSRRHGQRNGFSSEPRSPCGKSCEPSDLCHLTCDGRLEWNGGNFEMDVMK
jgi:hypothetical protein